MKKILVLLIGVLVLLSACKKEKPAVQTEHRCANCNMIVEKYPSWIQKVILTNHDTLYFDGARCMFKILNESEKEVQSILVKDYYTLEFIDGRQAWYVIGSDVLGPMGNELIPFKEEAAANGFFKDHAAEKIVRFDEVDLKLVMRLAKGMEMH